MNIVILENSDDLGNKAAVDGADAIREALSRKGFASIILATGTSQFATLEALTAVSGIDWTKVTVFHLDEYLGMKNSHPASFAGYLKKRFLDKVPSVKEFVFLRGDAENAENERKRISGLIKEHTIDVAFIGIGENGHIAFNDPPADFTTQEPYIIVELDEACRNQQLGEGWFPTFADVPNQALTMSVYQILQAKKLVVSVPDERKAPAVRGAVYDPITPDCPAAILRTHENCMLYLEPVSASLLVENVIHE